MLRHVVAWLALILAAGLPVAFAVASPLLQWREPIYIIAGFAGVIALSLLLLQPLLAGGYLPGLSGIHSKKLHRGVGLLLLGAVLIHVTGLWITSPPDVIDALLFASPTPFSVWGVLAMWALLLTTIIALLKTKLTLTMRRWKQLHKLLAVVIVAGSVIHAVQIEGTMETISKIVLCVLVIASLLTVLVQRSAIGKKVFTR